MAAAGGGGSWSTFSLYSLHQERTDDGGAKYVRRAVVISRLDWWQLTRMQGTR